jgi:uncharacterized protein DUF669
MSQTVLDEAFDPEKEEGSSFDLLPPGKYPAEIEDARVVVTKNGNGQMVNLRWKIVEGEYENRTVFQSILIQHTSADAQKFGRQKFKDVAVACGITDAITDLDVLKYKACTIHVGIEKDKNGEYPDKNRVTRVSKYTPGNGSQVPPFNDAVGF